MNWVKFCVCVGKKFREVPCKYFMNVVGFVALLNYCLSVKYKINLSVSGFIRLAEWSILKPMRALSLIEDTRVHL